MMKMMKAAVHTSYGTPEVVQVKDVPIPAPKENELLVKVHASTVNRTDCGFRSAEYFISRFFSGLFYPKQKILGNEFAGEIIEVGAAVKTFSVGDKVFGYNDQTFGCHAAYLVIAEDAAVATMPEHIDYAQAAPITEGAHYALVDIRAAKVQPGQQVLVYGATGAIGSAAVQLLKYFGAEVTAVCATPHVSLVQSLGANTVIDYLTADFTQCGQTFDFIFDAVGKSSFKVCKPLLKEKGMYISTELGKRSANVFLALFTPWFGGKKVLFPIPSISKADVIFLKQLVEEKHFTPLFDRQYPLQEIVAAYRYVESRQKLGNVVISME